VAVILQGILLSDKVYFGEGSLWSQLCFEYEMSSQKMESGEGPNAAVFRGRTLRSDWTTALTPSMESFNEMMIHVLIALFGGRV
jgi:hypothetical protein